MQKHHQGDVQSRSKAFLSQSDNPNDCVPDRLNLFDNGKIINVNWTLWLRWEPASQDGIVSYLNIKPINQRINSTNWRLWLLDWAEFDCHFMSPNKLGRSLAPSWQKYETSFLNKMNSFCHYSYGNFNKIILLNRSISKCNQMPTSGWQPPKEKWK